MNGKVQNMSNNNDNDDTEAEYWTLRLPRDMKAIFDEYAERTPGYSRGTDYVKYLLRKEMERIIPIIENLKKRDGEE